MRECHWNRTFYLLVAAAALGWASQATRAYLILSWDVDTLVARSPVIVEGEIANVNEAGISLRVAHVYRGDMKEGSSVAFGDGSYRTSQPLLSMDGKQVSSGNFVPGDRLVCFLGPDNRESGMERIDKTKPLRIYGLRLVSEGKVVNFQQRGNPGYSVAQLEPEFASLRIPLEDFQKQLTAAVRKQADVGAEIKKAADERNSPQLVAILRQRPVSNDTMLPGDDLLTHDALNALAALHDYPVLADALLLKNAAISVMATGFYTAEGREFLLQTIGDNKIGLAKRIACIGVLPHQGLIELPDRTFLRDPHYVARFAQLAADNVATPELCVPLVGRVGGFGGMGSPKDPDVLEGMEILANLYKTTANEPIRYSIEQALSSNTMAAYNALQPPGGFVLAIIKPQNPDAVGKPVGRHFMITLERETLLADNTPRPLQTEFLLQSVTGGDLIDCGAGESFSGGRNKYDWTTHAIALPASSPVGKYHVFAQFSEDGKVIGRSHFLEVEVHPD